MIVNSTTANDGKKPAYNKSDIIMENIFNFIDLEEELNLTNFEYGNGNSKKKSHRWQYRLRKQKRIKAKKPQTKLSYKCLNLVENALKKKLTSDNDKLFIKVLELLKQAYFKNVCLYYKKQLTKVFGLKVPWQEKKLDELLFEISKWAANL